MHTVSLRVTLGYSDVSALKHALPRFEAQVAGEDYGTDVTLTLILPEEHEGGFVEALAGMTNGKGVVDRR